jgi:hypothetical protein
MNVEQQVLEELRELPPQKQEEVLAFVSHLRRTLQKGPRQSLRGIWAGLGFKINEEDIANARREMWGNFPRDAS